MDGRHKAIHGFLACVSGSTCFEARSLRARAPQDEEVKVLQSGWTGSMQHTYLLILRSSLKGCVSKDRRRACG
jgi:hypothetical protein